ncbi:hypothetical protein [Sphingomonas sp. ID0503]|uniref:hypothetical protein n=1 Tax=Sphingomonas sp. ID0503 TaxID=3399691 RepID=UPI003AFAA5CD
MPFRFNMLLEDAGIDPTQVRLLRHQTPLSGGRTLLDIWHGDRAGFEDYQSIQKAAQRTSFARPYWAAFVGTWEGRTMFAGLYEAGDAVNVPEAVHLATGEVLPAGDADRYQTRLSNHLRPYIGSTSTGVADHSASGLGTSGRSFRTSW